MLRGRAGPTPCAPLRPESAPRNRVEWGWTEERLPPWGLPLGSGAVVGTGLTVLHVT